MLELRWSAFINCFSNWFELRERLKCPWNPNSGYEKGDIYLFSLLRIRLFGISLVHLLKPSPLLLYRFLHDNPFSGRDSPQFLASLAIYMLITVTRREIPLEHSSVFSKASLIFTNFLDLLYHPALEKMDFVYIYIYTYTLYVYI